MLTSQYNANAQHPDKYDGHEFTPRKARMIEPDIASMSPDDLREVLREPFSMPEHAARFEGLVLEKMMATPPPTEVLATASRSPVSLRKLRALLHNLRTENRWMTHKEISDMSGYSKSSVTGYLQDLTGSGRVVRKDGRSHGAFVYKATPATP